VRQSAPPPRRVAVVPAATSSDRVHVVEPGENLWSICDHYYGDTKLIVQLAQYNGLHDPAKVKVGMPIKIPTQAQLKNPTPPVPPQATVQ
ncbi:MAG: LysM peptidoglycan-binding domain-containing protein, partial [Candidatus Xenobia bacterium]